MNPPPYTVTFVTGYFNIYDIEYDESRTFEKRLCHFLRIAKTGIPICVVIENTFEDKLKVALTKENCFNVQIIDVLDKTQIPFLSEEEKQYGLPEIRNVQKDTHRYMALMNSKIDFVKRAIDKNPFSTNYFSWFDFSLAYVFRNVDTTIQYIDSLACQPNYIHSFIAMPGCWSWKINKMDDICKKICWRFCGGFFMGDKDSLLDFYHTSVNHYNDFVVQTNVVVWEVNYWAWLESYTNSFHPLWYFAGHDDSIIHVPLDNITLKNE